MSAPVDRWFDAGGLRLHGLEWDGGGGTTVLLLHGYLDLAWTWRFFVEALPAGLDWHLVALDWRGHGESGRAGAGGYYHFADYVRDLDAVARAARRERLVVVGHSMGAGVASLWLGARPTAADLLVMVEGFGPPPVTLGDLPDRMARWLSQTVPFEAGRFERPMDDLEHAVRRARRADPLLPADRAAILARYATVAGSDGKLRWRYDPLHRTRSPSPLLPEAAELFWRRISCPVLWVGGARSPMMIPAFADRLDCIPDLSRKILPEAGHMVQHHDPLALARAVVEFVGDRLALEPRR